MEQLELPTDKCKTMLAEVISAQLGTDQYNLSITQGSNVGDNFIGVVYRISAHTNKYNERVATKKEQNKSVNIILKVPPQNLARREQFFARPCFLREVLLYDEV